MATTLSYGYIKPVTGDRGSVWFPALESDIQRTNDHTHNGTDSALLPSTSVQVTVGSAPSGSWVAQGGGRYRQTVTAPAAITEINNVAILARLNSTKAILYPTIERVTATTFYVYTNDNSLTFDILYLS